MCFTQVYLDSTADIWAVMQQGKLSLCWSLEQVFEMGEVKVALRQGSFEFLCVSSPQHICAKHMHFNFFTKVIFCSIFFELFEVFRVTIKVGQSWVHL